MVLKFRPLAALLIALAMEPTIVHAADVQSTEIVVKGKAEKSNEATASKKARTSDTASMLLDQPGVSVQSAGGVSSLPVIHGLADDRVLVQIDGMSLISCCPNHMNPALSYLDPSQVGKLKVYAGISPVSLGGDSIGGTIIAGSPVPEFAPEGQSRFQGEVGSYYRSNGDAKGANLMLGYSTDKLNITYRGAIANSDDYKAGGDFKTVYDTGRTGETLPLDVVGSTAYETQNHLLNFAVQSEDSLYEAGFGYQHVPYQLYPNQRMDMLNNQAYRINLHYTGKKSWGFLEGRVYSEWVDHYMNFGKDKQFYYGTAPNIAPGMPMYTKGNTTGASLKAEIDLSKRDILRIGAESQCYRLDDWWPPSPSVLVGVSISGMAPNTFWNINDGKRDRYAIFSELESKWNTEWMTMLGARLELVSTDTGAVQGYNSTYDASASVFNGLDRKKSDLNLDLTALTRFKPDDQHTYEIGVSQKTRTPNLYERYAWSYKSAMVLVMNNYVGDGNGYLGNPDLKPEIAHTISASASWHSQDKSWELTVSPYFTYVSNYVDAVQWSTSNISTVFPSNQYVTLKFMNQTGRLYGIDISGRMPLGENGLGEWSARGLLNYVNGRNVDTDSGLYNIMPFNGKVTIEQSVGNLDNSVEMVAVARKSDISTPRQEILTPGYLLFHWRGSYTIDSIRFDFGVENILDKLYSLPLGGAYTGQGRTMSITGIPYGIAVPGMGRNAYVGLNYAF
ncbi:MAG: TonB-dependent receptor [Chlorobiaceae bacterium]|nr:TonB-dependent receptor [Chlorobiaceae bacterium]